MALWVCAPALDCEAAGLQPATTPPELLLSYSGQLTALLWASFLCQGGKEQLHLKEVGRALSKLGLHVSGCLGSLWLWAVFTRTGGLSSSLCPTPKLSQLSSCLRPGDKATESALGEAVSPCPGPSMCPPLGFRCKTGDAGSLLLQWLQEPGPHSAPTDPALSPKTYLSAGWTCSLASCQVPV